MAWLVKAVLEVPGIGMCSYVCRLFFLNLQVSRTTKTKPKPMFAAASTSHMITSVYKRHSTCRLVRYQLEKTGKHRPLRQEQTQELELELELELRQD